MTSPELPDAQAQKAAAVEVFAQYEQPLYEAYLQMITEWLASVRAAMFAGGVTKLALMPDPLTVFSKTPAWGKLVDAYAEDVIKEVIATPYLNLFGNGNLFESRPFVRTYVANRANLLKATPNEVYGAVKTIVDAATTNGASIPDVTAQIDELLDATHGDKWKNRAATIARTEVVGAYNGGTHDAFSMIVEASPDVGWVKRWLATDDTRTRPDHREADGQVVLFAQPFIVGGFMLMHPHDPTAPPKETVNCRCTELLEEPGHPTSMEGRQYKTTLAAATFGFNPAEKRDEHEPAKPDRTLGGMTRSKTRRKEP